MCQIISHYLGVGLPWWLSGRESTSQCRRHGFDPWVGKIPQRSKWRPTPVFLPGKLHGQRSLADYSSWGHKRVRYGWVIKQQSKGDHWRHGHFLLNGIHWYTVTEHVVQLQNSRFSSPAFVGASRVFWWSRADLYLSDSQDWYVGLECQVTQEAQWEINVLGPHVFSFCELILLETKGWSDGDLVSRQPEPGRPSESDFLGQQEK